MKALLFARLRELAGTDAAEASGSTVGEAWESLRRRFPGLPANPDGIRAARNQDFVEWDAPVGPGDELAFIPPVSGGGPDGGVLFELTTETLDARRLEAAVAHAGAGAICTFTGVVRDSSRGERVERLEYEAYAGMAEKQMRAWPWRTARGSWRSVRLRWWSACPVPTGRRPSPPASTASTA